MTIQIEYSLTRPDVSNWYWRRWRQGHWVIHLVIICGAICSGIISADGTSPLWAGSIGLMIGILVVIALMAYPMLAFKPEHRAVLLTGGGIETTVGVKSKLRPWNEVSSIRDENGTLVASVTSGQGFIIPPHAFASEEAKSEFLRFARTEINVNRTED